MSKNIYSFTLTAAKLLLNDKLVDDIISSIPKTKSREIIYYFLMSMSALYKNPVKLENKIDDFFEIYGSSAGAQIKALEQKNKDFRDLIDQLIRMEIDIHFLNMIADAFHASIVDQKRSMWN